MAAYVNVWRDLRYNPEELHARDYYSAQFGMVEQAVECFRFWFQGLQGLMSVLCGFLPKLCCTMSKSSCCSCSLEASGQDVGSVVRSGWPRPVSPMEAPSVCAHGTRSTWIAAVMVEDFV